jgi:AcrR family transcriptional regulator
MAANNTGKREANRLQIRQDLAFAAVRLFEQKGYDETTVDDIVSEAGVSRRTFFRHFPTKADVVFYDHEERLALIEEALSHIGTDQLALPALSELTEAIVPTFTEPEAFFLTRHHVLRANEALRQREQAIGLAYTRLLARFLAPRFAFHPQGRLLADVVAGATVTVFNRAQYQWASSGGATDPAAATKSGMALLSEVFAPVVEPDQVSASGQPTLVVISPDGEVHPDILERLGRALAD